MAAFGVFGLCQIHAFVDYLRSKLNPQQFEVLFRSVISLVGFVLLTVGALLMLTGREGSWISVLNVSGYSCRINSKNVGYFLTTERFILFLLFLFSF